WMVFGAMIRTVSMTGEEPGVHPLASALELEGFDDVGAAKIAESFARHLMVAIDTWQTIGFSEVAKEFLQRLPRGSAVSRSIDDNGDLMVRRMGKAGASRQPLVPALAAPSWLDPKTHGPRL